MIEGGIAGSKRILRLVDGEELPTDPSNDPDIKFEEPNGRIVNFINNLRH